MNIFAYDPDPETSALWLDDVRKNKMITETAQIFTSVIDWWHPELTDEYPDKRVGYPASVTMHTCTRWTRKSWSNFHWLYLYFRALNKQWSKPHASDRVSLLCELALAEHSVGEPTPFANCARSQQLGLDFTHLPVHQAYREYHCARWKLDSTTPTWRLGHEPPWYL